MQAEIYTQQGIWSKTAQKRKLNMGLKTMTVITIFLRETNNIRDQLGEIL
jgi:hypothetical protein